MVVQVYSDAVQTKYYSRRLSCSYLFSFATVFVVVILPFFLAFNSHSLWLHMNTYIEQPVVRYKYQVILFAEGHTGTGGVEPLEIFWSSLPPEINSLVDSGLRSAEIRSSVVDTNKDRLMDSLDLTLAIPLTSEETINKVSAFIFFDYTLRNRAKLNMDIMTYITHSSPFPGSSLSVDGDLDLVQNRPLSVNGGLMKPYEQLLNVSAIQGASELSLEKLISTYRARNYTSNFVNQYPLWIRDVGAQATPTTSRSFTLNAKVRIPSVNVQYIPDTVEVLKHAWIQYYAMLVIVLYFINVIRQFLYRHQILETVTLVDHQKSKLQ